MNFSPAWVVRRSGATQSLSRYGSRTVWPSGRSLIGRFGHAVCLHAWRFGTPVLCLAGKGPLDEAAPSMLAQLLSKPRARRPVHALSGSLPRGNRQLVPKCSSRRARCSTGMLASSRFRWVGASCPGSHSPVETVGWSRAGHQASLDASYSGLCVCALDHPGRIRHRCATERSPLFRTHKGPARR